MRKRLVAGAVFVFVCGGLLLFHSLGGFNPVQIGLVDLGEIKLTGIHFKGRPQDDGLKEAFRKVENLKNLNPGAVLHTIYFVEPAGKLDTMEVFVGLESKWLNKESELKTVSMDGDKAIVASISAHRFVMPGPNKVKTKIESFAKVQGLDQPGIFIDQIIGPNEVKVIALRDLN